ncbi:Error-prone DNA polymerase [Thiomonas arsenitoxydans]|uniref:Error-prone DNA polymerase n=1 Tax=Thiomonas arsenitoxydans (strain DSM 22701 / CIP 110005 / 3As) TaxID=426114 RepID=D6CSB8_THIA3|nr:error-prone DNA polymerase [Thiomonas arsenitoxydans]CAZ87646.1 Error-prone DNA polymerase [Thiomonas arsenitoxydans]CQR26910.1 Error-prone DNA polymerase [Thiomonas arsenitoxydans]CQR30295.1 Error-prone DNA polymerase [Thiomonas arsenitoxydans]CQR30344.1 Error-prone DNA polymerase [Thiomonas arsenitoxydans]CQR32280.1 Error-prone DNA polymerase [Thiomonas arsenitoxydans]
MDPLPDYVELHCRSNFSFLTGASHPEELVERAQELHYAGLAVTDECSLAGIVRAHGAAKAAGLPLLVGAQFAVEGDEKTRTPPFTLVVLACNLNGYGNLCEFITRLRRASPKGSYRLDRQSITGEALADCVVLAVPSRQATDEQLLELGAWLLARFTGRVWLAVELHRRLDDERWLERLQDLAEATAIPLVAAGDVHMHRRSRKPLQDTLTAIRLGLPIAECGHALQPNAERHLRSRLRLALSYPPELLAETLRVAARCRFSLDELRYRYPKEVIPAGETADGYLRRRVYEGAGRRWPDGLHARVQDLLEHELALIAELGYAHYFLTVDDIVAFARSRHILCQGRGSAANSAVCYALGITEVDPEQQQVLFERFISKERNEPPDIDVDFEHERREEVIQYLYAKYGRDRAALTAAVIRYRPKSALRDVGKALGFDLETVERLARNVQWWDGREVARERLEEVGLDPEALGVQQWMALVRQLLGFPRHLSQHTGGFVLTEGPLSRLVPIENASMPERTVIEWDKDDLDAAGLLKVDILALGMLTAIRKALDAIGQSRGQVFAMQDIPREDPQTYDMLCQADSVGVFQVESRAQQGMLPRLQPRCFYDLVIETAIVRPGPIQGGMVHPYLNRRQGKETVVYPSKDLESVLQRTLGVPVFQEQVMQIAMVAAGFSAGEADGLRRAMAAWRRTGSLEKYRDRLISGMAERGYPPDFAQSIYEQVQGFSEYGFPESHAASFALLVYASAWIKRHHPAEFLMALLNSQPMGFYTPSQLVQDAKRHGVTVRPVDVLHSDWDCTLEEGVPYPTVRLGLRLVKGLGREVGWRIANARLHSPPVDAEDLAKRAQLDTPAMRQLAAADALRSLSGHRRQQVWEATAVERLPALLDDAAPQEDWLELPAPPEGEDIVFDYATTGLSLRRHPLALLRPLLAKRRLQTAAELAQAPDGRIVRACGIVTLRQQPETAKGTTFVSLEDETGTVQVICWKSLRQRQRTVLLRSRLLAVAGTWQREGDTASLIAGYLEDLTPLLGGLATRGREFR